MTNRVMSEPPSEREKETLIEKDKIHILLQEYNSLRSELVSSGNKLFQLFAIAGTLVTWLIARDFERVSFWAALIFVLAGLFVLGLFLLRDTQRAAQRVAEIENEINQRAHENLLKWENKWGRVLNGFVFRHLHFKRKPNRQPKLIDDGPKLNS
jgi:hypothetical protein